MLQAERRRSLETTSRVTGERTVFQLNLDRLRSDEFIAAGRHPIEVVEAEGPHKDRSTLHGTKIRLATLTLGRAQNPYGFAERIARRFLLASNAQSFQVTVNGTVITTIEAGADVEFDFPQAYRPEERPASLLRIENDEGIEKLGEDEIRWRVRFCKNTIGDEEFRGVSVFCGIKVAQAPFFFELSGGRFY